MPDPAAVHANGADEPAVRFDALFESAPDAYLVLAPDAPRFTMVAANDARLRVTMTRREDVVGRGLFEVFPDNPTDPDATGVRNLRASLDEVIRTRRPHRMALQKYDIRSGDGTFEERYWEPLNTPVLDRDGALRYIVHRVEDVTEQVRTAQRLARETEARREEARLRREMEALLARLRESEARYRLLADMIPQNIWTTDATGHHTYFSRRWYEFSGAAPEESHGAGWMDFVHPDDRARTAARWQHALETGEPYEIEYRFRGTDGAYRWFLGKAMPLRGEEGAIVEWFGTATDITERKRLDVERERRRAELEEVTESRARLMRGFSHDVKNPLGAADGHAALLEEGIGGPLTDEQRRSVQRIRRSIQTSLHLIDDLLDLARADAGQLDLALQRVDVAALAREVAEDYRGQVNAAGLTLEVHAPGPLLVASDAMRVRQILGNLVSNAVKYTRAGGVTVATVAPPDRGAPIADVSAAVRVTDTGPGIPRAQQQAIFEEFTRLDPNAPHGAGVGLAISRRIACLLGGEVTVESEVGRGAAFTLWLPAAPPAQAACADV